MACFITIEGIEGAGKSTLRARLAELLKELQKEVVLTREPGATPLGQSVRTILLDPTTKEIHPIAELMLFSADRAQHVSQVLKPALDRGAIVVCDRYIHSTLAYQGYGRGIDLRSLKLMNDLTTEGLLPDIVLLLDLDPEKGLERALERTRRATMTINTSEFGGRDKDPESWTRFEQQAIEFHSRVRDGFLALAKQDPERFLLLDAEQDPDKVAAMAFAAIKKKIASHV